MILFSTTRGNGPIGAEYVNSVLNGEHAFKAPGLWRGHRQATGGSGKIVVNILVLGELGLFLNIQMSLFFSERGLKVPKRQNKM